MIDVKYAIAVVAVMTFATMLTRFLPFVIFKREKTAGKIIEYLGQVLPAALMSFLLVYCVKDISFDAPANFAPTLVATFAAIALHAWKRNTFLSIALPTFIYMVMIHNLL